MEFIMKAMFYTKIILLTGSSYLKNKMIQGLEGNLATGRTVNFVILMLLMLLSFIVLVLFLLTLNK